MFGYIVINKDELKIKDYNLYRSFYCGLCQELKKDFGHVGQISLSYDMTFIILLLTALYEEELTQGTCKCIAHPFEKHPISSNCFTSYAADMNLILTSTYKQGREKTECHKSHSVNEVELGRRSYLLSFKKSFDFFQFYHPFYKKHEKRFNKKTFPTTIIHPNE